MLVKYEFIMTLIVGNRLVKNTDTGSRTSSNAFKIITGNIISLSVGEAGAGVYIVSYLFMVQSLVTRSRAINGNDSGTRNSKSSTKNIRRGRIVASSTKGVNSKRQGYRSSSLTLSLIFLITTLLFKNNFYITTNIILIVTLKISIVTTHNNAEAYK